jgi:copper chaperone CopZ
VLALCLLSGCDRGSPQTPPDAGGHRIILTFDVQGMDCTGCERTINDAVAKVPGVMACRASFENGTAEVEIAKPMPADAIVQAIDDKGYTATLRP